ncbi:glycosyltransferase family 2 protein [Bordetella hinzii]|uniref:glycosyltransferase family 2 protein n=1 Tax=Bordetella hinzii TaxID=103855 RepID=UPI00114F0D07|nr:glycosyltransferase family A protein [Bordetella hinzii]MCJ9708922.1 glycosyltransferase family 2 protein [Bordetella hinzii]QDJ48501.1 capsular biosynthesis protein [Bordetella hinzii]WPL80039.1 glycosyltransferase family A protein [Bordetella hinzii]
MSVGPISVCIATYRRAPLLDALLGDLAAQTLAPAQVVVVDNDAAGSARAVVQARQPALQALGVRVDYAIQPEKNISLTRNRAVELARGPWLAMIDDDERAPPQWLALLAQAAARFGADAVQAPVLHEVPATAPAWVRRGRFYDWPRFRTGEAVPLNALRLGNFFIRADWLKRHPQTFDPAYGLTGGEDGDMLMRLAGEGARIVWCDEAHVVEPVAESRMTAAWILKRALRGGQDFAVHFEAGRLAGRPSTARRLLFYGRAAAQMAAAGLLALLSWPLGRHHAVYWLGRACANYGKLSVLWGGRYHEYA